MVDLSEELEDASAEHVQVPDDAAILSTLLPRIMTAVIAWVGVLALLRHGSANKTWDKAMFVGSIALAVLLSIAFLMRPPKHVAGTSATVFSAFATGGLLVGIACVERPELTHLLWEGFGVSIATVSLIIALYLWNELERIQASRPLRSVLNVAVAVLAACDLLSLFRTLHFMADVGNNTFLLNEMLAPAAGRTPDGNFVSSYVTLYGWFLVPFHHFLAPVHLAELAMIVLSVLGVLSVVIAVVIAYRSMSSPSFWIAAGLVVPLTTVTVLHFGATDSSIGSFFQELPYRMFPAMLVSLIGLEELVRLRQGITRSWHLPAVGALAGLFLWNTQDFGLAVIVAYSIVLAVALPRRRQILSWFGGMLGGFALYPLLSLLTDAPVKLTYFAFFARTFAGGLLAAPIQVPGPVLVVLPLLLSSTAVGWSLLWRQRRLADSVPAVFDRTVLTLALIGTWSMLGFVYYLNRSYASGQLQIFLMPCGVCLVALVSLAGRERKQLLRSRPNSRQSLRVSMCLFPVALLVAMGFGALLQSPNPVQTVRYLTKPSPNYGFESNLIPQNTIQAAEAFAASRGGSLGYFGASSNFVQLATGLPSLLLYDDPGQFADSPTVRRDGCLYLRQHSTKFLLISPTDQGPADTCGLYTPVSAPNLAGLLFIRKGG